MRILILIYGVNYMDKRNTAKDFKSLMVEYVQKKMQASVFLLLYTLKDLDNNEFMPECLSGNKDINLIKESIIDITLNLENIMDGGSSSINSALSNLADMKDDLINIGHSVFAYNYSNNITADILSHFDRIHWIRKDEKDKDDFQIDFYKLMDDCMEYIRDDKIKSFASEKKADIIKCFPLRMTKQKYNDYIRTSVKKIINDFSEKDAENFIKMLKLKFYPFKSEPRGNYLESFKKRIDTIADSDFESFNKEDFDNCWDEIDSLTKELEELMYYLDMILEAVIYLTLILNFASSFDFIFDDNLVYKDIYFTFKENFKTENFEIILDAFAENLDVNLENILDECINLEKYLEKLINKPDKIKDGEDVNDYINIYKIINSIYNESMFTLCFPISAVMLERKGPDNSYINDICEGFIDYVNESVSGLKNSRQKLFKQFFLEVIPCFMDDNEFIEYLEYTFEEIKSFSEKILTIDYIGKVFKQNGFEKWEEEDEHIHNHGHFHNHDGSCGCGHNH